MYTRGAAGIGLNRETRATLMQGMLITRRDLPRHPNQKCRGRTHLRSKAIQSAVTKAASDCNKHVTAGAAMLGAPLAIIQRDLINTLTARHRLPAVYPARLFVAAGGLIS